MSLRSCRMLRKARQQGQSQESWLETHCYHSSRPACSTVACRQLRTVEIARMVDTAFEICRLPPSALAFSPLAGGLDGTAIPEDRSAKRGVADLRKRRMRSALRAGTGAVSPIQ